MKENIGKQVMKKSAKTFSNGEYFDTIVDVLPNPDFEDALSYLTSTGSYLIEAQTVILVDTEHFQHRGIVYDAYKVLSEYPVRHWLHKIAIRYLFRTN